jgi:protein-tyrosine phosphatase
MEAVKARVLTRFELTDRTDRKLPKEKVVDFDLLRTVAGTNLRDLGGHPTRHRGHVRRGMVFRSAHLAKVPEHSPVHKLKLRTLVTLQSRVEVSTLGPPDAHLLGGVRWEHIPMGDRWFDEGDTSLINLRPGHVHLALINQFRDNWRAFFSVLARRDAYPLLFHCSAGRDRTGVGAAMLLEALGVERERIVADFLASNAVFPQALLTPAELAPVFRVIDEHGGIDAFMCDAIGLANNKLGAIRQVLLQDEPAARIGPASNPENLDT